MRSVCCGERDEPPSYADAVCCRGRLLATYAVWSSHMSLEGAPPVRTLLGAGWALARTEVMIRRCHQLARGLQSCAAPAALSQLNRWWLADANRFVRESDVHVQLTLLRCAGRAQILVRAYATVPPPPPPPPPPSSSGPGVVGAPLPCCDDDDDDDGGVDYCGARSARSASLSPSPSPPHA